MTPVAIAETLGRIVPGFEDHWSRGDSLFLDESGGFTAHGVFAECNHFVSEHFSVLPIASVKELAHFVSDCVDGTYGESADNAASTCFLENLAGEPFHGALAGHLRPAARQFYDRVVGI